MSEVEALIDRLARDARPVRPLRPPLARALAWLAGAAAAAALAISAVGDAGQLLARYAGREALLVAEMAAILATGVLAVVGAFFLAVPGRSNRWQLAPLPPFAAWLLLSGAGCLATEAAGHGGNQDFSCLAFIVAIGLLIGAALLLALARARPIAPLAVALLGGLGSAALAAFTLQFFHPSAVTVLDLAVHLAGIALVVGAIAALNRRALSPA